MHAVALLALGCVPPDEGPPQILELERWTVELAWDPDPPAAGPQVLVLSYEPPEGTLSIDAWMPAHSHGLSEPPALEPVGPGEVEATFVWPMGGLWELTIELTDGDTTESGVLDVVVE